MDGIQLLKLVEKNHPKMIKVVSTGHYDVKIVTEVMRSCKVFRYLRKPWDKDADFIPTVLAAIEEYYGKN
jgi:DNA-binding NtrC family response regulator